MSADAVNFSEAIDSCALGRRARLARFSRVRNGAAKLLGRWSCVNWSKRLLLRGWGALL
jgi:hypothetical protein